ncbi:MAG: GGDEF domain-containing protein [Gordonia sp. (in: high G+C Gram-positive bacteria)]
MIIFDIRTLLCVVAVTELLLGVVMAMHGVRNPASGAMRTWAVASALTAVGWLLVGLRDLAPDWLSVGLADAVLIGALMLVVAGMRQFTGRRLSWALVPAPSLAVVLVTAVSPIRDNLGARVVLVNLCLIALLLVLARDACRDQRIEPLAARRFFLTALAVAVLANAVTAGYACHLAPTTTFLTAGTVQEIGIFVQGAALLGGNLGMFLMAQERLVNQLRDAAHRDALTEVLNRRGFAEAATGLLTGQARTSQQMAVLLLDLDGFKAINDTHGHTVGDCLLRACAKELSSQQRPGELVGRYGGDEFCALLLTSGPAETRARAEQLRRRITDLLVTARGELVCATASVGVAEVRDPAAVSVVEALAEADQALYRAKRGGRDRVCMISA